MPPTRPPAPTCRPGLAVIEFEQRTRKGFLRRLWIRGGAEELRAFALDLLDAIDDGRAEFTVESPDGPELRVKIRRLDDDA